MQLPDDFTPAQMQEQCASVADQMAEQLMEAAHSAAAVGKKSWWLPWRAIHQFNFMRAAMFAASINRAIATVIRNLPSDRPVVVSLEGLQVVPEKAGDETAIHIKPKGVTLQ